MKAKKLKIFRNTKPLLWYTDETLIVFKKTSFYFLNPETAMYRKITSIKDLVFYKRVLMRFRFFRRLLRLEPSSFLKINSNNYLFCFNSCIYCLDIEKKGITKEHTFREGLRRTLSICTDGKNTFFGEYWTGKNIFGDVKIFKRLDKKWECCYTFGGNQIRHIHKLLINNNDLYCFTGDETSETMILRFANMDFSNPSIIHSNSQLFRSCCAVATNNSIFYTTDTPYENNKFISMRISDYDVTIVRNIESTSIFSSDIFNNCFCFSTVVEPNLTKEDGQNKRICINSKMGGIHTKWATFYLVNLSNNSFTEIYRLKKDFWPFSFGLGTFIPVTNCSKRFLAFYSSCLKKDGSTFVIRLTNHNSN